ncbi:MAG TPA: AmmeMemoRadiSam system protein B [Acidiferrobacterales bacterium]|nr:AmmeMemoRadiSam system protein B [Acidiferrobacterales bacterium]
MPATADTRAAAVAGLFYPADAVVLARDVQTLLATAAQPKSPAGTPKALIVPHAGYIYSGPVAASAYVQLRPLRGIIQRVVLLGPVHRVAVRGLALPGTQAFETPLGRIPIDREAVNRLLIRPMRQVTTSAAAHAPEHSLEVQLPFLQQVLGDFKLVPLAVGEATPEEVAEVIEALWGGRETLIVVSSDLSHYLPYQAAQQIDKQTCAAIARLQALDSHEQACGATPVNGLLLAARHHHLRPQLLDLRNSGDTAGDRERVVGYAAFAFTEEPAHAH